MLDRNLSEKDEIRQSAILSIVLLGGAALVWALYEAYKRNGGRIALGTFGGVDVENWLKKTASGLQRGSQSVIDSLDTRS